MDLVCIYLYIIYIIYILYMCLYLLGFIWSLVSLWVSSHTIYEDLASFLNLPKRRWQSKIFLPILTFDGFYNGVPLLGTSWPVGSYSIDCWAPCFHCCSSWTSHCQWLVNSISDDFIFLGSLQAFLAVRVIIPFIRSRMTDDPDCWVNTILISIPLKYPSYLSPLDKRF